HGALRLRFGPHSIHGDAICGPPSAHDDMTCTSGSIFDSFVIGDEPPSINGAPGNMATLAGQALTINITASDWDGEAISSLGAILTGLPAGNNAKFVPGAGNLSGQLTWTPATRDTGSYTIRFRAANALACTTQTIVD